MCEDNLSFYKKTGRADPEWIQPDVACCDGVSMATCLCEWSKDRPSELDHLVFIDSSRRRDDGLHHLSANQQRSKDAAERGASSLTSSVGARSAAPSLLKTQLAKTADGSLGDDSRAPAEPLRA